MKKRITRILCAVLIAALVLCACAAQADTISEFKLMGTDEFSTYSTCSYVKSGNYMGYGEKGKQLFNAQGEAISELYDDMIQEKNVYRVHRSTGFGLIDAVTGQELVPCQYGYAEPLGGFEDWYIGFNLEKADDKDYDFTDFLNRNYHVKIVTTDVYHGNQVVATLTRDQFNGETSSVQKKGSYIWIKADRRKQTYTTYDGSFNKLRTVDTTMEYETDYSKGKTIHVASGQEAFTEGCTLAPEDVSVPYKVNNFSQNGVDVLDLQGNVVLNFPEGTYDSVVNYNQYSNGYLVVQKNEKYGLVSLASGKEVIPCVMDTYSFESEGFFAAGYQCVVEDGKVVVYNEQGECVQKTEINPDETRVEVEADGLVLAVGEYGDYQLLSVTDGFFPGKYKEYLIRGRTIRVTDTEDHMFLMDVHGNVIQDLADYGYCEISGNGTTVIAKDAEHYKPHIAIITYGE